MTIARSARRREGNAGAAERWARIALVQAHYRNFVPFLEEVMGMLGFETSDIQREIAEWMEHGPQYLMVQAQRGQAKTTVAAAFAVWTLIHSPAHRVLIVSAAGKLSNDIATLIIRIIETMDVLECLRPDKNAGDRASTESYDIHHSLKGVDKTASVACIGIDANMQGWRADLLIADDVESKKNSVNAVSRAKLADITRDFTSINSTGRILWLGTPQTLESIYNALPARGVAIRIWPGRYPNADQMEFYQGRLAPSIVRALQRDPSLAAGGGIDGTQGQPIDPVILPEDVLQRKEQDQGAAYFQLQHMLNTTLADSMKHPIKLDKIVVIRSGGDLFPALVARGFSDNNLRDFSCHDFAFKLMSPHDVSRETLRLAKKVMYIDPAAGGANADETAYAVGGFLNGNVFIISIGGIPGGYDIDKMQYLADKATEHGVDAVIIEKNMGYGAFRVVFQPVLKKVHPNCQLLDDQVSGQKEVRIIETLGPVIGRGSLIVTEDAVQEDISTSARYAPAQRQTYSAMYQLAKISATRGALVHDDRADALEGLVRHFQPNIATDQDKSLEAARRKAHEDMVRDPLGHNRCLPRPGVIPGTTLFTSRLKHRR